MLDQLCGPLCDAVLESSDAAGQLRRLEAASLFVVPLDRQRHWYRYHALFREFLLGELGRAEPAIIATLHQKAADWYEASGSPAPAVEHLLQTTDTDRTVRLVTRLAQATYAAGQMSTLQRWLRAIGDANIERYPSLAVQRCWVSVATGDTTGAQRWAAIVDAASFDGVPGDGSASFDSTWAIIRAAICAAGPEQMMADAAFAVAQEPAGSEWRGPALSVLAQAHLLAGQLDQARAALAEASAMAAQMGNFDLIPICQSQLAWLAMDRGEWPEAAERLELALATIDEKRLHDYGATLAAFVGAARLALHRGDRKEAHRQLARAMRARPAATYLLAFHAVRLRLQLARVYLAVADPATARQLLREIDDILRHRPALGALTLASSAAQGPAGPMPLTPAELRLLPYLQTHLTADKIAERLFISRHTVKTQFRAIYRKLGVTSRNDAVQKATAVGLLGG